MTRCCCENTTGLDRLVRLETEVFGNNGVTFLANFV